MINSQTNICVYRQMRTQLSNKTKLDLQLTRTIDTYNLQHQPANNTTWRNVWEHRVGFLKVRRIKEHARAISRTTCQSDLNGKMRLHFSATFELSSLKERNTSNTEVSCIYRFIRKLTTKTWQWRRRNARTMKVSPC